MPYPASYSEVTMATIPRASWQQTWTAIEGWKGWLQSFPGMLRVQTSARELDNGDVRVHLRTFWAELEALDEWMKCEWSGPNLLRRMEDPAYDVTSEAMQDYG